LTNAISKMQAGTDKTAAELAINRLKADYQQFQISCQSLETNCQYESGEIKKNLS